MPALFQDAAGALTRELIPPLTALMRPVAFVAADASGATDAAAATIYLDPSA